MKKILLLGALLPNVMWAQVEMPFSALLPPENEVRQSLEQHPMVQANQATMDYERANAQRLIQGEDPWQARFALQQRRNNQANLNSVEQTMGLEKRLRLPSKVAMDKQLAQTALSIAQLSRGDAWHEAAKILLADWFAVSKAQANLQRIDEQLALLDKQLAVINKRISAGDAPRLERLLVEQERAKLALQRQQQHAELAQQQLNLQRYYRGQPLSYIDLSQIPSQLNLGDEQTWIKQVLAANHELELAEEHSKRQDLHTQRVALENKPDPTLGITYSREQAGQENIIGLSVSVPLFNPAHKSLVNMAQAQASQAHYQQQQMAQRLTQETKQRLLSLSAAQQQLQQAQDLVTQQQANSQLFAKAYQLGEVSINDWLLSMRQYVEASQQRDLLKLSLAEDYSRLLVDSHLLWGLAEDE